MKSLTKKITDLCIKSRELQKLQFEELPYEKNQEIKKQQTEAWNKFQFFKKLAESMDKKGDYNDRKDN